MRKRMSAPNSTTSPASGPIPVWRVIICGASVLLAVIAATLLLRYAGVRREAAFMGGIFVLAGLLWVTEALPLFATALVVVGLEVIFLANPGDWPGLGFASGEGPSYRSILTAAADPVVLLFFGGFLLARAAIKEGVDSTLASIILKPFGTRSSMLLLGIMLVTALFSMWMSNTATAAMMFALIVPMLNACPPGDPLRKSMVLAVAFAANVGGMATPIGTPPNAVAIGFIRQAGVSLSFLEWMLVAGPLMLGLLLVTWMLLMLMFRSPTHHLHVKHEPRPLTPRTAFVMLTFTLTVLLWLTEPWHGLPAAVVALLPAVAFTCTGLLTFRDVNSLDWNILILIAGGIALGAGMQMTGLDKQLVFWLTGGAQRVTMTIIALLVIAAVVLSTFMSNTAAANLLLPIGITLAANAGGGRLILQLAFSIALAASVAMVLPVSTPPNAIAYARGEISARDMAKAGSTIAILSAVLITAFCGMVLRFWGF